jgi:hypothetical protein
VVVNNEIRSYEFVEMKEIFLLNEFLTLPNVVRLVRERLGLMDEGCEIQFEGHTDIGSSNDPWMKMMSLVYDEKEWTAFVVVVMKSEIRGIELVARMVFRNDVGDESSLSPTCLKRLTSSMSNVASCLLNHRKKLSTPIQRSPHSLVVMK